MKKLVTAEMMQKIDELVIKEHNIKGLTLMNNAGSRVFEKISDYENDLKTLKVTVVCGSGNNGGDGFVVAEHLNQLGSDIIVLVLAKKTELKGDAKKVYTKLAKSLKNIKFISKNDDSYFNDSDIIVDAIFGTGFNSNPEGLFYDIIKGMNDSSGRIYSIDVPSGIHGTTGNSEDIAVKADHTITLGFPKIGLYINEGYVNSGVVDTVQIGLPKEVEDEVQDLRTLYELEDVKGLIKDRSLMVNKKDFGKVFNFAGSLGMPGAAVLSSMAALRTGTGLLKLGIPMNVSAQISTVHPEIMTLPLAYAQPGHTSINAERDVLKGYKWGNAVLIGPGLTVHPETKKVVKKLLLRFTEKPTVLDADALNILSESPELLGRLFGDIVITPHDSEMARLVDTPRELLLLDRMNTAMKKAVEWRCHIVLKGTPKIVANTDSSISFFVNKNPALAVGGAGDVLSGILVSLLGQNMPMKDSILVALNIHSIAAEYATEKVGENSLLPSDIVAEIPNAIKFIKSM